MYVQKPGREGYVPIIEPYANHWYPGADTLRLDNYGPLKIPQGQYFVMGDNRDDSSDSRDWGLVPRDHIIGRGLLIYWSFVRADRDGVRAAGRRPSLTTASRLLTSAGAFFTGTRWERSGRLIR